MAGRGMTALVVEGIPPWDGRYEIPDWYFTNRELYRIKQISNGIRAGELLEALDANDTAAFVAVAVVILERHEKIAAPDDLWDAKVGAITIDLGEPDADVPPSVPPSGGETNLGGEPSGSGSSVTGEK